MHRMNDKSSDPIRGSLVMVWPDRSESGGARRHQRNVNYRLMLAQFAAPAAAARLKMCLRQVCVPITSWMNHVPFIYSGVSYRYRGVPCSCLLWKYGD